jgi:predicted transcriptional regulator of viral defense system
MPLYAGEIPPFAVAAALVQPMAISHWSALAQHGFTTQLPAMVQASTPRKVITPEMRNGAADRPRGRAVWKALGVEIEYIYVQEKQFFGHQQIWVNNWQQVSITDPERTALDLIARPDIFGGMEAAIEILEEALPRIMVPGLVQYALRYHVGAVIKRLGWLLERLGVASDKLAPLQAYPVSTYYRLDPQAPASHRYAARWHINENLKKDPHA